MDGTWTSAKGSEKVALYLYRGAAALNSPGLCTGTHYVAVVSSPRGHRRTRAQRGRRQLRDAARHGLEACHWDEYTVGLNTEDPPEAAHPTIDNRLEPVSWIRCVAR